MREILNTKNRILHLRCWNALVVVGVGSSAADSSPLVLVLGRLGQSFMVTPKTDREPSTSITTPTAGTANPEGDKKDPECGITSGPHFKTASKIKTYIKAYTKFFNLLFCFSTRETVFIWSTKYIRTESRNFFHNSCMQLFRIGATSR